MLTSFEQVIGILVPVGFFSFVGLGIGGLLIAPIVALVCAVAALRKGLKASIYAVAGAFHSIMFLFPLVYLLLRMFEIRVPKPLLILGYAVLYVGALCIGLLYVSFAWELAEPLRDPEQMLLSKSSFSDHIWVNVVNFGVFAGLLWWHGIALRRLVRHARGLKPHIKVVETLGLYGQFNVFRAPFAVVWVSLFIGFPFVWVFAALVFLTDA